MKRSWKSQMRASMIEMIDWCLKEMWKGHTEYLGAEEIVVKEVGEGDYCSHF